jgi:hypothetical protein
LQQDSSKLLRSDAAAVENKTLDMWRLHLELMEGRTRPLEEQRIVVETQAKGLQGGKMEAAEERLKICTCGPNFEIYFEIFQTEEGSRGCV